MTFPPLLLLLLLLSPFVSGESLRRLFLSNTRRLQDTDFEKDMLSSHNRYRDLVGVSPLKWNQIIADNAAKWASSLQKTGCPMIHSSEVSKRGTAGFDALGENLAACGGCPPDFANLTLKLWVADQVRCYRFAPSGQGDSTCGMVGLLTQVLWNRTTDLGCALAECPQNSNFQNQQVAVCQYGPAGNYVGQYPFTQDVADKLAAMPV